MKDVKTILAVIAFVFGSSHALAASQFAGYFYLASTPPSPLTGFIDRDNKLIQVDDFDFWLFGPVSTVESELLDPGTYTRTFVDPLYGPLTRTATIPPGTVGAYLVFEWNFTSFQLFMAWDVSPNGRTYTNVPIPGNIIAGGPFNGISAYLEFELLSSDPYIDLSISAIGGYTQECTETAGSVVEMIAMPQLFNGAILDSIVWSLDGKVIGEGLTVSPFVPLGSHVIEAVATASNGDGDIATASLEILDTTPPELDIVFRDSRGNAVESARPGPIQVRYLASDACDPNSVVSEGSASRVYDVQDGDVMHINRSADNLRLPVSALEVRATARDSSGNETSKTEILIIE